MIVQTGDDYRDVGSIDIKRVGDTLQIRLVLANGELMPLKLQDHKLLDGAAVRIPLPEGMLRVRAEEPAEEPKTP